MTDISIKKNAARDDMINFITWCYENGYSIVRLDRELKNMSGLLTNQIEDLVSQYYENFSLRSHPHVQFAVVDENEETVYATKAEAIEFATELSRKTKQKNSSIVVEVIVYSAEGAKWYAGEKAAKSFKYNKNGCVFEQIVISAKTKDA